MAPRRTHARHLLLAAALGAAAGRAWADARRAEVTFPPAPVRRPTPAAQPPIPRRLVPAGLLAAAVAALFLMVAGMAFSAAPAGSLEQPARLAERHVANPLGEAAVASHHFSDEPVHVITPPTAPALPAPRPSEETVALARYAQVLGPTGMLAALDAERSALAQQVLSDSRVHVYSGGRYDLESGRVDPRVVAVIEYLADTYGEVSVSCLITGHSHFVHQTKKQKKLKLPKVVSAHVYGRAVDISSVAGIPIASHQQPGGITERTIRQLLALPDGLRPAQVISLLALGGPSFALPDHANHIHVGY